MKCENYFCVYQENGECRLDDIEIDILGNCDTCIYVDIPKTKFKKYKEKLRKELENR